MTDLSLTDDSCSPALVSARMAMVPGMLRGLPPSTSTRRLARSIATVRSLPWRMAAALAARQREAIS